MAVGEKINEAKALLLAGTPVSQVSKKVGYATHVSLMQVFRTHVGRTPVEWLKEQGADAAREPRRRALDRLQNAEELLRDTNMTINEVSLAAGYTRLNGLYAAFEREHGISPGAWRKRAREPRR